MHFVIDSKYKYKSDIHNNIILCYKPKNLATMKMLNKILINKLVENKNI